MIRTIIESPYRPIFESTGNAETDKYLYDKILQENISYARLCLLDSLNKGEAPFASHLLYTQVLDDTIPEQRKKGMMANFAWYDYFNIDLIAFYTDKGYSPGMLLAKEKAINLGLKWEERSIL